MAHTSTDQAFFMKAIEAGLKHEIRQRADKVIEEAKKRIEAEVNSSLDKIALELLKEYSIERYGSELRITVKKMKADGK